MKHPSLSRAGIGAISLFMALFVLSLTVISVLSYVEAKQQETLADQFKTHALSYAEADKKALMIKAMIAQQLQSSTEDITVLLEKEQILYDKVHNMVSYKIDIHDTQQLNITLEIKNQTLEVRTWEVIGR